MGVVNTPTSPDGATPTRFTRVTNLTEGGSSGYLGPATIAKLYILPSNVV